MPRIRTILVAICLLSCSLALTCAAQVSTPVAGWTGEKNALLTKLQTMAHGAYSDAEWQEVYDQVHQLLRRAEEAGNDEGIVDLSLLLARVQSDMRHRHTDALYTLSNLKDEYQGRTDVSVNRIYMGMAEVHARLGDAAAIEKLIQEFKNSPHYDPENYPVTGGTDPNTPVQVVRPRAQGDDSITVSTMQRHLRDAAFAPGKSFPDFRTALQGGGTVSLEGYRGKLLLVDCWVETWPSWKSSLPYLVSAYDRYRAAGFQVLGVYIGVNPDTGAQFAATNGMNWPQVVNGRDLARTCGVTGSATSFLVDGTTGKIVGRNLSMPELVAQVRQRLAIVD